MPQGLGMFAQNWTLLTEVCDSCNEYFGRELDLQISRDSIEAYLPDRFWVEACSGR